MELSLGNDTPSSQTAFEALLKQNLIARLKTLESRSMRKGCGSLDPARNRLIGLGTEIDPNSGKVTKDSYGVFNLPWQAAQHPEWADQIALELDAIRGGIRQTHAAPLKFLLWAGMGGSAEDKHAYNALGLLKRGPRCYVLDSTDPAKWKYILEDIQRRSKLSVADVLRRTLVVGMALGMTSYEPVVNLENLAELYDAEGVDSGPNFICMTLPDSLLDRFAKARGYRCIPLQLDGRNTVSGRTSSPLTRGSLVPLGLSGVDLHAWMKATDLSIEDIHSAWQLSAALHTQIEAGRDKVTLILPRALAGPSLWTKQVFEESLGKSEQWGIKVVIDEKIHMSNFRPPRDPHQDRLFLVVQEKGVPVADAQKFAVLKRAGYPVITLKLPRGAAVSSYMQFCHYAVFGLASLRNMNFVTQPSVELYKSIANRIYGEGGKSWKEMLESPAQTKWRGRVALHCEGGGGKTAPQIYANLLGQHEYYELTFFGDTRYSPRGKRLRAALGRAGDSLFRARLKSPVDVYEGPAMNHSYHEMIIGHGRCSSTILISESAEGPADYHRAQYLATIEALEKRGRAVVGITLKDLSEATIEALEEFFRQASKAL